MRIFWAPLLLILAGAVPQKVSAQPQKADEELQQFKIEIGEPDGVLDFSGKAAHGYVRAYVCPTFLVAETVIEAIRGTQVRQSNAAAQKRLMNIFLRRSLCKPAKGGFRIVAKGREVEINFGQEASEYWTALDVLTKDGIPMGLVFDASPYAHST